MRYVKGTTNLRLVYRKNVTADQDKVMLKLTGYTDSDWARDSEQRRSTAAYAVMANSAALSWSSKRLHTVCLSSTEAEYVACTEAAKELVSHRKFAEGLGAKPEGPTELLCDSQSAIALSQNPIYHARTKHVEIKHHYIRQLILEGEVILHYVATKDNTADVLTKALSTPLHQKHTQALGLCDVTSDSFRSKSDKVHWETLLESADDMDRLAEYWPELHETCEKVVVCPNRIKPERISNFCKEFLMCIATAVCFTNLSQRHCTKTGGAGGELEES